ncbi:repellent protein 1-like [Exaiptasia diaphana]|uniref:PLAT domain-containing protein n=1 Tax=Exaiptasia diaphana TaxID=2652724 RepID=A0A913YKK3_EXADI|nr:repellent protein 1-like [Exaiptasia diaphana]
MLSRFIVFGCILVFVKSQHVQYKVTISSDDEFNPDDRVSVAIYGQAKQTDHKELQGIYDKFNGHNEATFVVSAQDVGPIKQMKIKRVPNGPKEDWHVQKITIRDPKGNTYEFMCKCVLSKQKGPEVTTTPINIIKAAQEAPSPTETSPSPSTPSPSTNKPTAGVGSSSPPSEQPTGKKETTSKPTNEPTENPGATKETSPTAGATVITRTDLPTENVPYSCF